MGLMLWMGTHWCMAPLVTHAQVRFVEKPAQIVGLRKGCKLVWTHTRADVPWSTTAITTILILKRKENYTQSLCPFT